MFDVATSYDYHRVGDHSGLFTNRKYVVHLMIYSFKTDLYPYLLEVEEYPHNIYAFKFYRRSNKGNKQRFNLLTNEGKCARIVGTCFSVFLDIYNKNPLASFGFVCSNTIDKTSGKSESKEETKRFRIYRQAVYNYFGEETFTHFADPQHSVYLAISNKNKSVHKISEEADKILESLLR
jgi:uncharacterized protein YxeA